MTDCIFQRKKEGKRILNEFFCAIITEELKKGTERTHYFAQFCDFHEKENECPIVKAYEEYAETYHSDGCADCDHEDMEDPIRQCAEDAYS